MLFADHIHLIGESPVEENGRLESWNKTLKS